MYLKTTPYWIRLAYSKGLIWDIKTKEKVIYLTFDDGPIPEITPWVIDVLNKYKIKATFFCVGENVKKYPDIFNVLLKNAHAVGNHTFHHVKATKTNPENFVDEVELCNNLIHSNLLRPPHGIINKQIAHILQKDYKIIMWSVLSADFDKKKTPTDCLRIATKNIYPGCIVVFHDSLKAKENMQYALPLFIEHCLLKGYEFKTLAEAF